MEGFNFPVLSAIVFIPIIAGVAILFLPADRKDFIRGVAISASLIVLLLGGLIFFNYNSIAGDVAENQATQIEADGDSVATEMYAEGLTFQERVPWLPSIGLYYHLGVDGLSAPMVLLTSMVAVTGVLIMWKLEDRVREFMAFFMLLVSGVMGVFVSVDLFVLFFFYELGYLPDVYPDCGMGLGEVTRIRGDETHALHPDWVGGCAGGCDCALLHGGELLHE